MATTKFSIVVPCYSEKETLVPLLESFQRAIGTRTDIELVLVDNGSTDESAAILKRVVSQPDLWFARIVSIRKNRGYGFGVLTGLDATHGEFVAWTHADSPTDPAEIVVGFDRLLQESFPRKTFVHGVRQGGPWIDRLGSNGLGWLTRMMLGVRLTGIHAQPKICHRDFLHRLESAPYDSSLDLYALMVAKKGGYTMVEIPVTYRARHVEGGVLVNDMRGDARRFSRTVAAIRSLRRQLKLESTGSAIDRAKGDRVRDSKAA